MTPGEPLQGTVENCEDSGKAVRYQIIRAAVNSHRGERSHYFQPLEYGDYCWL